MQATTDWSKSLRVEVRGDDVGHAGNVIPRMLAGWPADMRVLVRREKIEHGTQLSLFEQLNGYSYQLIATATRGGQAQRLQARHRVHARAEGFIRCGKDTAWPAGPRTRSRLTPPGSPAVALAIDQLCAGTRLPLLDAPLAKAEPATLRYRLLHAAARLVKRSRHLILRVPETSPEAQEFAAAVNGVRAIP